jgi:hypothetical protein
MEIYNIINRVFVAPGMMEETISFYEELTGEKAGMRLDYTQMRLQLAQVDRFLIIAGEENDLAPFIRTSLTLLVDSIEEYKNFLEGCGAEILEQPKVVPTGINMRVKHPDGLIAEYVEHKQAAG